MQSAYEILSDPQEKDWYDSHRDAILRGGEDACGEHYEHNVRITTTSDIMKIFTFFHGKVDFSDSPTGFYYILRETFDTLAREEALACEWEGLDPVEYPSFGHRADKYDDVVRPFYAAWNGFATKKTFSWEDVYRYSDAPDRRVRRMMEKENKAFRDAGIREFNDAVRSLVAFVKKRDPRFKTNVKSEAERQKTLQDAAKSQAARQRAANQAKQAQTQAVPEWMKSGQVQEDDTSDDVENKVSDQFECVVCNKSFKSENQYEAHEKSRKHVRAVQNLKRQMLEEHQSLQLDRVEDKSAAQESLANVMEVDAEGGLPNQKVSDDQINDTRVLINSNEDPGYLSRAKVADIPVDDEQAPVHRPKHAGAILDTPASSSEDEYTARVNVEERIAGRLDESNSPSSGLEASEADVNRISEKLATGSLAANSDSKPKPKMGKAKEKRAKKAAQKQVGSAPAPDSDINFRCAACQVGFPSKTRLFNHIKDLGHAQPMPRPMKGGKGKK